jgi:NTE family protein
VVRDLLGGAAIENLPIPYTAVATDLIAGRSVWLQRGPLDAAIRASIAIPGMISPHVLDGRVLADGGILDPLPVTPLAGAHADLTVAVSLSGDNLEARRAEAAEPRPTAEWLNRLLRSTSALLETNAARSVLGRFSSSTDESGAEVAEELAEQQDDVAAASAMVPKLGSIELMNRTIEVMQAALARHHLSSYPPDIFIEVPRTTSRSLDFHRAADVIEVGRSLAARALDACADCPAD